METHCDECLRVTVGSRVDNEKFLQLLEKHCKMLGVE
jgi:histidinol-phosphate/aromatic aminotransferase/cobyric acid decarboxylase-like protein